MKINIYKDKLLDARLFGTPVLYSASPIPREDVPQGWYCYDLRGTVRHPDEPYALVDQAEDCHAGSVLSCLPLKSGRSQKKLVKDMFQLTGTNSTLTEFCKNGHIQRPETPIRHLFRPASPDEAGFFYALEPEQDVKGVPAANQRSVYGGERRKERSGVEFSPAGGNETGGVSSDEGTIGHVRIDFGHDGKEFCHTWWPRGLEELNTQEFRDELKKVVDDLRKGILKDLPSMRRCCYGSDGAIGGGSCCQNYGFTLETERYLYRLRCNPVEGDYQAYLTCFDKQAQKMDYSLTGEDTPIIGRVSFASGETEEFTDPEKYLQTVREELPYHATRGKSAAA